MFCRLILCMAVLLLAISSPVLAGSNIGVVDDQKLLLHSTAAQSIQEQVKVVREQYHDEFSKKEKELRAEEKALIAERPELSQEDFAKKVKAFEQKNIELQRLAQTKKRALDKASVEAVNQLRQGLFEIVQDILVERGFELIITHQNVIIGEKSIDITDEVMKRLNNRIKHIDLIIEE